MGDPAGPTPARPRYGAIDVGSNSIRLLVAEYDPTTGLTVLDEVKDQPRLAAGVARTGRLDPEAVRRALAALRRMLDVSARRGVERVAGVATSAVREAADGPAFLARVRDELGLELRVIDAETEAALSYRSVAHHFRLAGDRTMVADIGGGSLELIGAVNGVVQLVQSHPFGAVRLTELYLGDGADPRRAVAKLRRRIRRQLRKALSAQEWSGATVIGSGGTFTNLGRMAAARRGGSAADPVHGTVAAIADVDHLLEWLAGKSAEERRQVPGLNPARADIILAGLAVTAALLEHLNASRLTVSAFGLREGLLLEMAGADATPAATDPLRLAREFAERCHVDRAHAEQVRTLALQLFDQLATHLGAAAEERSLLETASLLHEVGQLVGYRKHHKHTQRLILHADRLSLSTRDRTMVAAIARYHRKRGPTKKHEEFAALDREEQAVVRRLAGILRVANGLDRGHTGAVADLRSRVTERRVTIRVRPRTAGADLSLECWSAQEAAGVLGKAMAREVVVAPALGPAGA